MCCVLLFGLYLLGVLRPAFLMRSGACSWPASRSATVGSALVGVAFGAAWTPCIGPILGAILTLAADAAERAPGAPPCSASTPSGSRCRSLTAVALDRFLMWFQRFRPYIVWVERIAGGMLIVLWVSS